jgi:hypothetical protein
MSDIPTILAADDRIANLEPVRDLPVLEGYHGGEILMTESTRLALGDAVETESKGTRTVRGRSEPVIVNVLTGLAYEENG